MPRLLYRLSIVALLGVSLVLAYYIGVNTLLADKVLPNVQAYGADASLLSDQELQQEAQKQLLSILPSNLEVQIDAYSFSVPTAELQVMPIAADVVGYGKGADFFKVLAEGLDLLDGEQVDVDFDLDTQAIVARFPIKVSAGGAGVVQQQLQGCHTGSYNIQFDADELEALAKQALKQKRALTSSLAQLATPDSARLPELCQQYEDELMVIKQQLTTVSPQLASAAEQFIGLFVENNKTHWQVSQPQLLEQQLTSLKAATDTAISEGSYEVQDSKVLLLQPYKIGQSLNIKPSIAKVEKWLGETSAQLTLDYTFTQPQVTLLGMEILDFTKLLGSGKTRIDLVRDGQINYVVPYAQTGVEDMHNRVVYAGQEFSFIDAISPQPGGWTLSGRPIGWGICNSATTLFRAALEAGFTITDRSYHPHYVTSYEWGYPENIVDAAYLTEPRVDVKFINNTQYPALLRVTISKDGQGWQYHTIDVYTSSQAPQRQVELTNFHKWNVQNQHVFEASFDRTVRDNGVIVRQDNFYSRYI